MLAFTFGGFGGAINAAYAMNSMVHNTAWIMGHFHVTLGTTVALTFMGATYWLLPRLLGRELRLPGLARVQPYLWFIGMALFSTSYHIAGLRGLPRRVYSAALTGEDGAPWHGAHRRGRRRRRHPVPRARSASSTVVVGDVDRRPARIEAPAFEFAVPLHPVTARRRLGSLRPVDRRRHRAGVAGLRLSVD